MDHAAASRRFLPGIIVPILLIMAGITGCAAGTRLSTSTTGIAVPEGRYRLYLYGCHHADDLENMALIVSEQAPFRFNLYAPESSYRITVPQTFDRAVEQADRFLRCGMRTVNSTRIRRILGPAGETAGYEMLPLYAYYELGTEEAVQIQYSLLHGVITVYIRLAPLLELKEAFPDVPGSPGSH